MKKYDTTGSAIRHPSFANGRRRRNCPGDNRISSSVRAREHGDEFIGRLFVGVNGFEGFEEMHGDCPVVGRQIGWSWARE